MDRIAAHFRTQHPNLGFISINVCVLVLYRLERSSTPYLNWKLGDEHNIRICKLNFIFFPTIYLDLHYWKYSLGKII